MDVLFDMSSIYKNYQELCQSIDQRFDKPTATEIPDWVHNLGQKSEKIWKKVLNILGRKYVYPKAVDMWVKAATKAGVIEAGSINGDIVDPEYFAWFLMSSLHKQHSAELTEGFYGDDLLPVLSMAMEEGVDIANKEELLKWLENSDSSDETFNKIIKFLKVIDQEHYEYMIKGAEELLKSCECAEELPPASE